MDNIAVLGQAPMAQPYIPQAVEPGMPVIPNVKEYEGHKQLMDVFNNGKNGQEFAVEFQLRRGEQEIGGATALAFQMSPHTPGSDRIINVDDIRKIGQGDQNVLVIKQRDNDTLVVSINDTHTILSSEHLKKEPFYVILDKEKGIGMEILGFDDGKNSILVHKIKPKEVIAPEPAKKGGLWDWGRKAAATAVTAVTAGELMAAGPINSPQQPVEQIPQPPAHVEVIKHMPSEDAGIVMQPETPWGAKPAEKPAFSPELICEEVSMYTMKPGDSLTSALMNINKKRYLNSEGMIDLDILYRDLACVLTQEHNLAQLDKTDPDVSSAIRDNISKAQIVGPLTSERVYDILEKLNKNPRSPGADKQLAIDQPGQEFAITIAIPKFPYEGR